jgi:ribonuclease HII
MMTPTTVLEEELSSLGYRTVVGLDEVGRGAWAGPVVAGAAILASEQPLPALLRDSKLLSPAQRHLVTNELRQTLRAWAVGEASVYEIGQIGIAAATFLAMQRAIFGLSLEPDFFIMDGFDHPNIPAHQQRSVIKGDAKIASIAAASVMAKVHRDALMEDLDKPYAEYGFAKHKGYGTAAHQKAIILHGLTPEHRAGFKLKFLDKEGLSA